MSLERLEYTLEKKLNNSSDQQCEMFFVFSSDVYDLEAAKQIFLVIIEQCKNFVAIFYPWHSCIPYDCILCVIRFRTYTSCETFYRTIIDKFTATNIQILIRPLFRIPLYYLNVTLRDDQTMELAEKLAAQDENKFYLYKKFVSLNCVSKFLFTSEKIQHNVYKLMKENNIRVLK